MSVSRRSFLRSGATVALTAGLAFKAAPLAFGQSGATTDQTTPFEAQQSPLFYFERQTFQPYVGSTFRVSAGRSTAELILKEVRDMTPSAASNQAMKASSQTDCFALIFHSAAKLSELTTIYDVEHAALGKFSLFLTRRHDASSTRAHVYEAVFNHFR